MSTEEIEIAMEYMNERYPDTMGTLVKFKAGYEPFKSYMFNDTIVQTVTPACRWRSLNGIVGIFFAKNCRKIVDSCRIKRRS